MQTIQENPVEVLVLGSGFAGSTMTAHLAAAGFDVLTLEAGPERKLQDMLSSQIWARRLKWGGPPVVEKGDLTGAAGFGMGWGTGGAALHWYANWYRFHQNDFRERTLYGKGLDWPIEYEDLRPYYDRAQNYVGVSGDLAQDPWSPPAADYPMPALPELAQSRAIKKGFDALGLRSAPNPVAINSQRYQDRTGCLLDGWCDAGCPIGALANPLVLQWPNALSAGAELKHNAYATRVTTAPSGKKATGVEYRDAAGDLHIQPAQIVIIACHTIWNSRLLLLSANGAHPDGLANGSGKVGRHFMSHPIVTIYGLFDQETEPYRGILGANILSQENYDDKQPAKGVFGSRSFQGGQASKPNDLLGWALARPDLYGQALDDYLRTARRHFGNMTVLCEETSVPENRIELDTTKTDAFGLPAAKVTNNIPKENAARLDLAKTEGLKIFQAADTSDVWASPRNPEHMLGGTLMGSDPNRSVTNSYGQTHEVDNLFIAGASLFPTSGAVNPTGTLTALVLRSADYIQKNRAALLR
ncbi:MAG: GMC family oxidoreductase [Stappiaceae bacterium]